MDEYKKVIISFLDDIESLDRYCDFEQLSDEEKQLFWIVRACRNKLAEVYNKIGDENWDIPDMILRV